MPWILIALILALIALPSLARAGGGDREGGVDRDPADKFKDRTPPPAGPADQGVLDLGGLLANIGIGAEMGANPDGFDESDPGFTPAPGLVKDFRFRRKFKQGKLG